MIQSWLLFLPWSDVMHKSHLQENGKGYWTVGWNAVLCIALSLSSLSSSTQQTLFSLFYFYPQTQHNRDSLSGNSYWTNTSKSNPETEIAQWLEHQTHDWKVTGLSPCRSNRRLLLSRVNFVCGLVFRYPFHLCYRNSTLKIPIILPKKCRWQVTAKHARTLCTWLGMKWHGGWLHGSSTSWVLRSCSTVSSRLLFYCLWVVDNIFCEFYTIASVSSTLLIYCLWVLHCCLLSVSSALLFLWVLQCKLSFV